MFVGLRRADGSTKPTKMKRLNKQYSLSRGIALTNRSSVITSIATKTTEPQINIEKLPEPVVKGRLYANDENDSMKEQNKLRGQFLLTLDEFALLDE